MCTSNGDQQFESAFLQRGVKDEPIETAAVRRIEEYCSDRGALRSAARPAGLAQWANSRQFGRYRDYAFLVSDAEFDAAFARIRAQDIQYYADPRRTKPGEINALPDAAG